MNHALPDAAKQHTPIGSLSWLITIWQKRRSSIKQAAGIFQKNSEQNAHYLLTILVTQELWTSGILCLLASIVDNRVPISYDYEGRTRLVACTSRIFASDTFTPTALGR